MLSRRLGPVFHSPPLERHPRYSRPIVSFIGEATSPFRLKSGHRGNLFARKIPAYTRKPRARILRPFGIFHHLPKTFHAGVTFAMKRERRRRKIREQPKLIALRQDHF